MAEKIWKRDTIHACWRVAAIHRCVLRYGASKAWAIARLREVCPEGKRDHFADNWFCDADHLRRTGWVGSAPARGAIGLAA